MSSTFDPVVDVPKKRKGRKRKGVVDDRKPKRPLSAYNYFFKAERERIIASVAAKREKEALKAEKEDENVTKLEPVDDENKVEDKVKCDDDDDASEKGAVKQEDSGDNADKPIEDEDGNDGESVSDGEKRAISKEGGDEIDDIDADPLSFRSLGKRIAERWKNLSKEELDDYKKLADEDTIRYKEEMKKYKEEENARRKELNNAREIAAKNAIAARQQFNPQMNSMHNQANAEGMGGLNVGPHGMGMRGQPTNNIMQMNQYPNEQIMFQQQMESQFGGPNHMFQGINPQFQQNQMSFDRGSQQLFMVNNGGPGVANMNHQQVRVLNGQSHQMGGMDQQQGMQGSQFNFENSTGGRGTAGLSPEANQMVNIQENGNNMSQMMQQQRPGSRSFNGYEGGPRDNSSMGSGTPGMGQTQLQGQPMGAGFHGGMIVGNGVQMIQDVGGPFGLQGNIQQMYGNIGTTYMQQTAPMSYGRNIPLNQGMIYDQQVGIGGNIQDMQGQEMYLVQRNGFGLNQGGFKHQGGDMPNHPGDGNF